MSGAFEAYDVFVRVLPGGGLFLSRSLSCSARSMVPLDSEDSPFSRIEGLVFRADRLGSEPEGNTKGDTAMLTNS